MNVKRYIAPNVQEAMIKVKNELGRDAIILHTRKIKRKGLKGLFKKPVIEVVAAIEETQVEETKTLVKPISKANIKPVEEEPEKIPPVNPVVEKKAEPEVNEELLHLKAEMDEIKSLIKNYMQPTQADHSQTKEVNKNVETLEEKYKKLLLDLDIDEDIIDKVFNIVKRQVTLSDHNTAMFLSAVKQAFKDYLGSPYTIDHIVGPQKVFVFVGPTGVGKTTTLAKLAAKLSLLDNKKVGLITADTYRIAAVDQLKTYSEILGIPLSVVYEASELSDVMFKYKDKDIVLLDTAGRSHKSDELSRDLQDLINNLENPEIFLVLSLTTGYKDIINILDAYSFIDDHKIIFTKLDEASSFSNILNVKVRSGSPLSYVTTGQSVPDDIEVAYPDKIIDYILGEVK